MTSTFSTNRFSSVRFLCAGVGLSALLISGCDEIDKMNADVGKRPVANNPAEIVDAMDNVKSNRPAPANPATNPPANPAQPAPNPATDPNMQKVDATVGAQGKDYGGGALAAPITYPISEYFTARGGINFMAIQHDVDIWHALNNRFPRNLEEFRKEILEPGNRELPDLPVGDVYVYEAKTGQLFVQHNPPKQ